VALGASRKPTVGVAPLKTGNRSHSKEEDMKSINTGVLIASAAAALLLTGALSARAEEKAGGDKVHCGGVNACKGQGACAGGGHACAGKNACKGQGWTDMSAADCKAKGGKDVGGMEEKK